MSSGKFWLFLPILYQIKPIWAPDFAKSSQSALDLSSPPSGDVIESSDTGYPTALFQTTHRQYSRPAASQKWSSRASIGGTNA
jgi:hypothetical protein